MTTYFIFKNVIVEDNSKVISGTFPDEQLMAMNSLILWYANFVNYLAYNVFPIELKSQQRKTFLRDAKSYQWDDPLLFKRCADQVIRGCVPQEEYDEILTKYHSSPYGEHSGGERIA